MYCYYSRRLIVSLLSNNKIGILLFKLSQPKCSQCEIYIPPENTRKTRRFSDVSKVYRSVTLGRNGLLQAYYVRDNFVFQPVVPNDIISVVRCNCKETKEGCCTSAKCSCRSDGLKCVSACTYCHGDGCDNSILCSNGE